MTTAIAAAVAIVPSTLAGVGIAIATGKAAESIARQPEAASTLRTNMIIGCAITETTGIYSLLIAFLILFAL